MSATEYDPDWIPPPGATIEDLLARSATSKIWDSLKHQLGEEQASKLLRGDCPISAELAELLANTVGLSAAFWLEREQLYRNALSLRVNERRLLRLVPLAEMEDRAILNPPPSHAETVDEVVRFFNADDSQACLDRIEKLPDLLKQKTSRTLVSEPGALAAWVRVGEREADRMGCAEWNKTRLSDLLPEIRQLVRIEDPARYLPKLVSLCRSCGVALVTVRAFNGCRARGVAKFLSPTKAMVLLSYRHLTDDHFWFSVFHELAHLLLHPEDDTIDDWDDSITAKELEADQFAADTLIPPKNQQELFALRTDRAIVSYARRIGVSRGIVVGQMQYRRIIGFDKFNRLKVRYRWREDNQIELNRG